MIPSGKDPLARLAEIEPPEPDPHAEEAAAIAGREAFRLHFSGAGMARKPGRTGGAWLRLLLPTGGLVAAGLMALALLFPGGDDPAKVPADHAEATPPGQTSATPAEQNIAENNPADTPPAIPAASPARPKLVIIMDPAMGGPPILGARPRQGEVAPPDLVPPDPAAVDYVLIDGVDLAYRSFGQAAAFYLVDQGNLRRIDTFIGVTGGDIAVFDAALLPDGAQVLIALHIAVREAEGAALPQWHAYRLGVDGPVRDGTLSARMSSAPDVPTALLILQDAADAPPDGSRIPGD